MAYKVLGCHIHRMTERSPRKRGIPYHLSSGGKDFISAVTALRPRPVYKRDHFPLHYIELLAAVSVVCEHVRNLVIFSAAHYPEKKSQGQFYYYDPRQRLYYTLSAPCYHLFIISYDEYNGLDMSLCLKQYVLTHLQHKKRDTWRQLKRLKRHCRGRD